METSHRNGILSRQLLPCGKSISNRLVKVAMYEHLASIFGGEPNEYHWALYSAWSQHDWGMIITGNVIVSPDHLTLGRDITVPKVLSDETLAPFQQLARSIHGNRSSRPLAVMQLNHAGRQSSNILGGRFPFASPLGPSALRFGKNNKAQSILSLLFHRLLFQTPVAMSSSDINTVISDFVRGALLASRSGFDGVQLHVAHGYLLAQFLSPKANIRTDEYSCDSLLLLSRIVKSIREVVPPDFILGIKFNTSDYSLLDESQAKAAQERRALSHLREIVSWKMIDFIEISGGDYENPEFMLDARSVASKSPRQAFFAQFSSKLLQELASMPVPKEQLPLILLTGGLRSPAHLYSAISSKHADLLGIGRGSVLSPDLPTILHDRLKGDDIDFEHDVDLIPFKPEPDLSLSFSKQWPWKWVLMYVPKISLIGAGVGMAWYVVMIRRLAEEHIECTFGPERKKKTPQEVDRGMLSFEPDYSIGGVGAVIGMWLWTGAPEWKGKVVLRAVAVPAIVILCIGVALFNWMHN